MRDRPDKPYDWHSYAIGLEKSLLEQDKRIAELEKDHQLTCESFTKTMEFAIENDEIEFLSCWIEGDWDGCREWSEDYDLHPAIFYPEGGDI